MDNVKSQGSDLATDADVILRSVSSEELKNIPHRDLLYLFKEEQRIRQFYEKFTKAPAEFMELFGRYREGLKEEYKDKFTLEYEELSEKIQSEQLLCVEGKYITIKRKIFGCSSEKSPKDLEGDKNKPTRPKKKRTNTSKKLSDRYPNIPRVVDKISLKDLPTCECCSATMEDSGMVETREFLTVEPRKFILNIQEITKYRCSKCHGSIVTPPTPPRIAPGSSYSDELIIDIALSKYCDLIPIGRYATMAARQGVDGLPANSLIEQTHTLANFLDPVYTLLRKEACELVILSGDDTTHRQLERNDGKKWFLWGFSGKYTSYYECHGSRASEIASDFLKDAKCEVFLSDAYASYAKAINEVNEIRAKKGIPPIQMAYCNSHSRRHFFDAHVIGYKIAKYYIAAYRKIYILEHKFKETGSIEERKKMKPFFRAMRKQAKKDLKKVSAKSKIAEALKYYLNHYHELTLCTRDGRIPIDNNRQESLMRSPVVGRKTWYGTHSKRGSTTAAKLFSIVESCKLCKVNPREYFKEVVAAIHNKQEPFTPYQYSLKLKNTS